MVEAPVRIGFIGAGGIARQRHLPGLKKVPGVEFVERDYVVKASDGISIMPPVQGG